MVTSSLLKKESGFLRNGMVNTQYLNTRILKKGVIDSLPSKLKEVYKRYLNIIQEGEMDIVQWGWTKNWTSEKKLIELLEKRIKGEKIELP